MECDRRMGRMESFNASIGEHKKKLFKNLSIPSKKYWRVSLCGKTIGSDPLEKFSSNLPASILCICYNKFRV